MFSEDKCPALCSACRHRHFSYDESIQQKMQLLAKKLEPWAHKILKITIAPQEYRLNYRNKVCLHSFFENNQWQFGMLSRRVFVATPECPVHHPIVNQSAALIRKALSNRPEVFLKYYVQSGKQVLLVLKTRHLPAMDWLTEDVKVSLQQIGIEGLCLHLNPSAGHKVFGKHGFYLVYGHEFSKDDKGLMYGPMSFQQLIPTLYFNAVQKAYQFLKPDNRSIIIDLYCGNGGTLKESCKSGAICAGVELNGEALGYCAINVPEAFTLRGRCKDRLPQLDAYISEHAEYKKLLYVNPPRTGLEEEVTRWITNTYKPEKMAYLSCSPGTLFRDLSILTACGYAVVQIIPFDFFPYTSHVESLVLMKKEG